jgi:hypothetical protein
VEGALGLAVLVQLVALVRQAVVEEVEVLVLPVDPKVEAAELRHQVQVTVVEEQPKVVVHLLTE